MVISSQFYVEMEASVNCSLKKWSKWTSWCGSCGVGIRIRSRICGDGYQCPIQLENENSRTDSGICMALIINFYVHIL